MPIIYSFKPIIDTNSKVLVLGSMPGVQSLTEHQYYAHPRNHFWKILFTLFDIPLEENYEKRIKLVQEKGIAVWDVLGSCTREGSLDSNIKHEVVNDFTDLFTTYPNIKAVFFNGGKAFDTFKRNVGFQFENVEFNQLPSTSPANTQPFKDKLEKWAILRKFIK